MVKNNRLKQTKRKRQTKHKRQTKRKMRRQIGGRSKRYSYTEHSSILKQGTMPTKVFMPGYEDICDMIETYLNGKIHKKTLDAGIKSKDVTVYTECKDPDTTANNIIVLRKGGIFFNSSINCEDTIFWKLASHNFKIFIDILQWNPFLNIPEHTKDQDGDIGPSPLYGTHTAHTYNKDQTFSGDKWWNQQSWWGAVKEKLEKLPAEQHAQPVSSLSVSITPTAPPQPVETTAPESESLEMKVQRLEAENQRLQAEVQRLETENQRLQKIPEQAAQLGEQP